MKKMWNLFAALFVMAAVVMTSCSNPSDGGGSSPSITDIIKGVAITDYYASAEIGDIILADGIICKPENFDSSTMKAVAVIFRKYTAVTPALGVAIKDAATAKGWVEAKVSCEDYGTAQSYTNFASGWYMPSSTELLTLSLNRAKLDASFGFTFG